MGAAAAGKTFRLDVRSADGTRLAVWVEGQGPPLVLVHGSLSDHKTNLQFVDELRGDLTTFSMDRRGFGASGDGPDYAIEREFEDVAAVVDAVATLTGGPVALWGHSYGAGCAMGAATLTANVSRLILYEPGLGLPYAAGCIEAIEETIARGDREAALLAVLVGIVGMTEEEIGLLRSSPTWPARLATVPTVPRECRVEEGWVYRPGQFDAVTAPTLMLSGTANPPELKEATRRAAAAIPHAQVRVLEGHGHIAHRTHPGLVAGILREFVLPPDSARPGVSEL